MRITKFITATALSIAAMAFTSCNLDTTIAYGVTDVANVENGHFITDYGVRYNIVEFAAEGKLDTLKRAYIYFDVLAETEGKKDEYDIKLHNFGNVVIKEPEVLSQSELAENGKDGINIFQGWISNKYFNAQIQYTAKVSSKKEHKFNIVFDDTKNNKDTLHFKVLHNAFGESYDNSDISYGAITTVNQMVSFPLDKFVEGIKDGIYVRFDWTWFRTDGDFLAKDKVNYSATIPYIAEPQKPKLGEMN